MKTYGTIEYNEEDKVWEIDCEPHVALRLKRVFPKIHSWQVGNLRLSNTIENARDLEWFLTRYPMSCSKPEFLKQKADAHRDKESLVHELISGIVPQMDFPLALPAREYQADAAQIARKVGSLLIADDVGLGKTVTAIAAFSDPAFLPCLVVVLAHLPKQWKDAVNKFAPHLRCHILKKSTPYDLRDKDGVMPDVIITSYHKLSGWSETLGEFIKTVVYDECQELRRCESFKWQAAEYISSKATCRMGLSATPIYNYGHEIWNVMQVINPGALGNHQEFITEWCSGCTMLREPKVFGQYLRSEGLMVRRTRKEVGRELPGLTVIPHIIESDELSLNSAETQYLAETILREGEDWRGQKMNASAEFDMRLRQATGIAKAPFVAAFVKMLVEDGQPVVLYGWHRAVYEKWENLLCQYGPVFYTGTESPAKKEKSKEMFLKGDSQVFIISLRAGAGLDGLQEVCNTVVFGELDWSPAVHWQNIGRVNRDGQKDPVFAYYLLSNSGSDPVVSDVLGLKTIQIEGLKDPNAELVEKYNIDPNHIKKLAQAYLNKRAG